MNALIKKLENLPPEELAALYQRVFTTDDGQLVLQDLKGRCWYDRSTAAFVPEVVETYAMIYREGMRAVLLTILTQLEPIESTVDSAATEAQNITIKE